MKEIEVLLVPCQYILSLMLFVIDNPNNYKTGLEIHGLHTRSKNQLFSPAANLPSVQKGIAYSSMKVYNSLPSNILNLKNDRTKFTNEVYSRLLNNSFYCVQKFLELSCDN